MNQTERYRDLRTFTAGAACGFLAGAFAVSVVVWQFGNVIGSRSATAPLAANPRPAVQRWEAGLDDAGPGVLQRADEQPASTIGRNVPVARPAASDAPSASHAPAPAASPFAETPTDLGKRALEIPVEGIKPEQLTRQFNDQRGRSRLHEALDILAPRNTPVRAVEGGRIARLFLSKAGGITVYQFDPSEQYCYYYAHLERYADGLREGETVTKGQLLGYVGTTGNAPKDTPHLHFAVFKLTDQKRWWEGTPLDPYDILR